MALILVHTPVHASRLNQAEVYQSMIQRKVLAPSDFTDVAEVARTPNEFGHHETQIAKPFDWTFTRQDLAELRDRLAQRQRDLPSALAA